MEARKSNIRNTFDNTVTNFYLIIYNSHIWLQRTESSQNHVHQIQLSEKTRASICPRTMQFSRLHLVDLNEITDYDLKLLADDLLPQVTLN